jgi:hypothetical protein
MALEPILAHISTFSTRYESKRVFKDGRPRMTSKQIFRVIAYQKSATIDDTIYLELFLKLRRGLSHPICNINQIFHYTGMRTLSSDINSPYWGHQL